MNLSFIPDDTFIGRYMQSMSGLETPKSYDFWCACWLMSLALGRHTVVLRPNIPVYMNCYVILCADSGLTRKSTAISKAVKVANLFIQQHAPEYTQLDGASSPAALEAMLSEQSRLQNNAWCAIHVSELVTLLGRNASANGLPGLLTDLYDCPDDKKGGVIAGTRRTMRNVYLSFLSASTPSWLVRAINPDVIEGGFTSRCMFVVEERPKRSVAWPAEQQATSSRDLCLDLVTIRNRSMRVAAELGGIAVSRTARQRFADWYSSRAQHKDPYRSSFASREDHHVLRVAGYLCANDARYGIEQRDIDHAVSIVESVREQGAMLFAGGLSSTKTVRGVDKLRDALIRYGRDGASQATLTTIVRRYLSADELRTILAIMHEMGLVQRFEYSGNRGAPKTVWRATDRLASPGVIAMVAEKAAAVDQAIAT